MPTRERGGVPLKLRDTHDTTARSSIGGTDKRAADILQHRPQVAQLLHPCTQAAHTASSTPRLLTERSQGPVSRRLRGAVISRQLRPARLLHSHASSPSQASTPSHHTRSTYQKYRALEFCRAMPSDSPADGARCCAAPPGVAPAGEMEQPVGAGSAAGAARSETQLRAAAASA